MNMRMSDLIFYLISDLTTILLYTITRQDIKMTNVFLIQSLSCCALCQVYIFTGCNVNLLQFYFQKKNVPPLFYGFNTNDIHNWLFICVMQYIFGFDYFCVPLLWFLNPPTTLSFLATSLIKEKRTLNLNNVLGSSRTKSRRGK